MRRRLTSLLLSLSVLVATLSAGQPVLAADTLSFPSASLVAPRLSRPILTETVISPLTAQLSFAFWRTLASSAPASVTVRDSEGNDPGWSVSLDTAASSVVIKTGAPASPLKPNETYTVTFKGGPDGVASVDGVTLPADALYTLRTTDAFALVDAYVWNELREMVLPNGGQIDQGVTGLQLHFTEGVERSSIAGNVSMTDSQGSAFPMEASGDDRLFVWLRGALAPNETYTIHIKGGTEGLKSWDGKLLAQDAEYTFTTTPGTFELATTWYRLGSGTEQPIGTVVPRSLNSLAVELNRSLACSSVIGLVKVTDSQGNDARWTAHCDSNKPKRILLQPPMYSPVLNQVLLPNETYTVQVKGGPEGIRSGSGMTLATDPLIPFTTSSEPVSFRYWRGWPYDGAQVNQSESYVFTAGAGPLTVDLAPYTANGVNQLGTQVTVTDVESGEILMDQWFDDAHRAATVTLPKVGTYYLDLSSNQIGGLGVKANDIQLDIVKMPALQFVTAPKRFETKNQPFTVTAAVQDAAKAGTLWLQLKGQSLAAVTPSATQNQVSAMVDPGTLADGIYWLSALADGNGNENLAWQEVPFLVDRVDTYQDVPKSHWARPYIEVMSHQKILAGAGDGLFAPGRPVRRDEFAKMLVATLGLEVTNPAVKPFADMKEDWAKPYLQAVYEAGYMKGEVVSGKRYFHPEQTISRAEAAVTLARVLGADQIDIRGYVSSLKDWSAVPAWAQPSVAVLTEMKWLNGFPDGTFGPSKSLNRDQSAKVLANFLGMQ